MVRFGRCVYIKSCRPVLVTASTLGYCISKPKLSRASGSIDMIGTCVRECDLVCSLFGPSSIPITELSRRFR